MTGEKFITVDGIKFHKLTPYDRMEIAEKVRKERRSELEANLKAAQATSEQLMAELEQFDTTFKRLEVMFPYIQSEMGRVDVFERALKRAGSEPRTILENFTPDEDDAFQLAADLCGIKLKKPDETKPPEDTTAYGESGPNPQKPAEESYTQPAT